MKEENLPDCWRESYWDGKKSDQVLVELRDNSYVVAVCYEIVDCSSTEIKWYYDTDEYLLDQRDIVKWMYIPY